jgi:hypothetical protein
MKTRVYVEVGKQRVFASAADWPGWARAGKDEETALEALAAAAPRYAAVAKAARIAFAPGTGFEVVERLPGNATTDFGAPGAIAKAESRRLTKKEAGRLSALVAATWTVLDRVIETAPASLRKRPAGRRPGPRRDLRARARRRDHVCAQARAAPQAAGGS